MRSQFFLFLASVVQQGTMTPAPLNIGQGAWTE